MLRHYQPCRLITSPFLAPAVPKINRFQRSSLHRVGIIASCLLGICFSWAGTVNAQVVSPPDSGTDETIEPAPLNNNAPPELLETLAQIDAAANQRDLGTVMEFYSPAFTNTDGLTYEALEQALATFWERYPKLTYTTELNGWERQGDSLIAETTTTITGMQADEVSPLNLTATITSRQRFENMQVVEQEILAEESQLTQGENPPVVTVILPEEVGTGEPFEFDAIVYEPLGDRLLLGAALEEEVQPNGYFDAVSANLELLSAGGLFKVGNAPAQPDDHWISAIIIREDGITTVTRRLRVVPASEASNSSLQ